MAGQHSPPNSVSSGQGLRVEPPPKFRRLYIHSPRYYAEMPEHPYRAASTAWEELVAGFGGEPPCSFQGRRWISVVVRLWFESPEEIRQVCGMNRRVNCANYKQNLDSQDDYVRDGLGAANGHRCCLNSFSSNAL